VQAADPELFKNVKAGKVPLPQAKRKVEREAKAEQWARKAAAVEAARRDSGNWWELKVPESPSHKNFDRLRAKVERRPEFAARKKAIRAMEAKAEELAEESQRLEKQAWQDEDRFEDDVQAAIAEQHGPIVSGCSASLCIADPAKRKLLQELQQEGDAEGVREVLLRYCGRRIDCGSELGNQDHWPGKPGFRYVMCTWCRKHLGKTHCTDCRAPLKPGEESACAACLKKEEEEERRFNEQSATYVAALDYLDGRGPCPECVSQRAREFLEAFKAMTPGRGT
jgi:hypothetical protein